MNSPDLAGALESLFDRASAQSDFSGAALVSRGGEPVFQGAYGMANRAWGIENTIDTRFRIASISKMFTAVAVLQLIDKGKLSFETSLVDSLNLGPTTIPSEATVYHMLTMTSGIADWFDESGDWEANWDELIRNHPIYLFRQNEDYLPLFRNEQPAAGVCEKYQYNGAGYILLGLLIEKISGLSYFDAVRGSIFKAVGMESSDFIALDEVRDRVAEGYLPVKAGERDEIIGWRRNIYSTTPAAAADGGATSTAGDLLKFSQSLRKGELLSGEMTAAFMTPQVKSMAEPFRGYDWMYGFGNMFILEGPDNIIRWGHTGEEDGVSCRLYYYPGLDLDVILLGNQSWCTLSLSWQVHDLLTGSPQQL